MYYLTIDMFASIPENFIDYSFNVSLSVLFGPYLLLIFSFSWLQMVNIEQVSHIVTVDLELHSLYK